MSATLEEERAAQTVPPEQLALPGVDGRSIDVIEVAVGGTIKLNRSDPADCALIRRLRLGEEISLKVDVQVVASGGEVARDSDGYVTETKLKKKLTVVSLSRPAGEQLDIEADGP